MLFNSSIFIFIFLPLAVGIFFLLTKFRLIAVAKIYLILASLFFYAYWNPKYLAIILGSIIFNFAIGVTLSNWNWREKKKFRTKIKKRSILIFGLLINILLLGYYKYCNFFIENINSVFHTNISFMEIALPLAISFFTFQQISYLVDSYNGKTKEYDFMNYALFVTFFPQLIAGPIVRHNDLIPQFQKAKNQVFNWKNFSEGLFLFIIGLSKKVLIADTLAILANNVYSHPESFSSLETLNAVLAYTFQIYYDFSGYTDMALGIGKMFNINLPQNFNMPYKSISIEDFWQRWHMTLSRFLKDYVYIPLGGNKTFCSVQTKYASYFNVMITFLISGLWHGASWLFVLWGFSHGIVNCLNKFLRNVNINIYKPICWLLTFIYINLTWIIFRSDNTSTMLKIFGNIFNVHNLIIPKIRHFEICFNDNKTDLLQFLLPTILIIFIFIPFSKKFKPQFVYFIFTLLLLIASLTILLTPEVQSPFLYFNF